MEHVQEATGGSIHIQLMLQKRDRARTAEKDLIVEARYCEEEDPTAELIQIIDNHTP